MKKFEYKIEIFKIQDIFLGDRRVTEASDEYLCVIENAINNLGEKGWELMKIDYGNDTTVAHLKRELLADETQTN